MATQRTVHKLILKFKDGGNIKVDFSEDKYCEFSVILPLKDEDIELTDQKKG